MLAAFWLPAQPGHEAAREALRSIAAGRNRGFVLDLSEMLAVATVTNRLRAAGALGLEAESLIERILRVTSALEEGDRLRVVGARRLAGQAVVTATGHDLEFADAMCVTQAILSQSILAFTATSLALPFERMQATIPQFQFELLG